MRSNMLVAGHDSSLKSSAHDMDPVELQHGYICAELLMLSDEGSCLQHMAMYTEHCQEQQQQHSLTHLDPLLPGAPWRP
jgi:hypothetical protein